MIKSVIVFGPMKAIGSMRIKLMLQDVGLEHVACGKFQVGTYFVKIELPKSLSNHMTATLFRNIQRVLTFEV